MTAVDVLHDCVGKLCDAHEAGAFGVPGEPVHDQIDALTSLLAHTRDQLDDPLGFVALVTKWPEAAQLTSAIYEALLLADKARGELIELECAEAAMQLADATAA
jgi:hypothetical protein